MHVAWLAQCLAHNKPSLKVAKVVMVVMLKVSGTHTWALILPGGEGLSAAFTEKDTFELSLEG